MKKILFSLSLLLLTILLISSCATSVTTEYMVPSTYDMSSYRNLAIISPIAYRFKAFDLPNPVVRDMSGTCPVRLYSGFSVNSERVLNEYLSSAVLDQANMSTYFSIIPPSTASTYRENLSTMAKGGIDAVLYIWTEDIDVDEFIFAKEEKVVIEPQNEEVTRLIYFLEQSVRVKFVWEVKSTKTGAILARDSFRDQQSATTRITTEGKSSIYAPRLQGSLHQIASSFSSTIFSQLEPSLRTRNINLLKNKPKSSRVEEAYKSVKEGSLREAQVMFEKEWKRNDHIPSAYNAALLLEALDERDDAINLLDKAYKKSGNTKIRNLLDAMKERSSLTKQAESQL